MIYDVFISYARDANKDDAIALKTYLQAAGVETFLDERAIEIGEQFPEMIVDALLGSRVVVVLLSDLYFSRPYCWWEWQIALSAYKVALVQSFDSPNQHLSGIVIALSGKLADSTLEMLPEKLRKTNWPQTSRINSILEVVRSQLAKNGAPLASRLDQLVGEGAFAAHRTKFLALKLTAPEHSLTKIPSVTNSLPMSIGEEFVEDRDILWRIDEILQSPRASASRTVTTSLAIVGMGGSGKSRIAIEYAHRKAPQRYRGGVFWLDADVSKEEQEAQHFEIVQALLGAAGRDARSLAEYRDPKLELSLFGEIRRALSELDSEQRVLAIVDNVLEAPSSQAFNQNTLQDSWAGFGLTDTIFTSRLALGNMHGGVQQIELKSLTDENARLILQHNLHQRTLLVPEHWTRIANWVGNLPLVLSLLNRALRHSSVTEDELLHHAETGSSPADSADELEVALLGLVDPRWIRGVSQALAISFQALSEDEQFAVRVLAKFAPAAVPLGILDMEKAVFSPRTKAVLSQRSFVGSTSGAKVANFGSMHRVLSSFINGVKTGTELSGQIERVAHEMVSNFLCSSDPSMPTNWVKLDAGAQHGKFLLETRSIDSETMRTKVVIATSIGNLRWNQGNPRDALAAEKRGVALSTVEYGLDHPNTLRLQANLAASLTQNEEYEEAIRTYDDVVKSIRGDSREVQLFRFEIYHGLSTALLGAHRMAESLMMAREAWSGRSNLLGANHEITIASHSNYAKRLEELGRDSESYPMFESILAQRIALWPVARDTQVARTNLAETLIRTGRDPLRAEQLLRDALTEQTRLFPEGHHELCSTKSVLVPTLLVRRAFAEAESLAVELLQDKHFTDEQSIRFISGCRDEARRRRRDSS